MKETKELPEKGRDKEEILKALKDLGQEDPDYTKGKLWSLVYYHSEEHTQFLQKASNMYFHANALKPMAFKSLKKMEWEVVRITTGLLHGDENVVGTMTAGGTESCLLAVKTYRDWARATRPEIVRPQIIAPESVHVSWQKGAEYFDVEMVYVPTNPDYRVDPKEIEKRITANTILILGSAPDYPFGQLDPIQEMAEIALSHKIPLHVDACLGGFFFPFLEKLGYSIPPFDFQIPGVTSLSVDLHKYGYSEKGASLLLYRDVSYLQHQVFVYENWPGGVFAEAGILGTRPGSAISAAWASLQALGKEGYREAARLVIETTQKLQAGIEANPELYILGKPQMSIFAYASRDPKVDIYAIADAMEARGWHIDRSQRPRAIHSTVTPVHCSIVEEYLKDLRSAISCVRENPHLASEGNAAAYSIMAELPWRSLIKKNVRNRVLSSYSAEYQPLSASDKTFSQKLSTRIALGLLKIKKLLRCGGKALSAGWSKGAPKKS